MNCRYVLRSDSRYVAAPLLYEKRLGRAGRSDGMIARRSPGSWIRS